MQRRLDWRVQSSSAHHEYGKSSDECVVERGVKPGRPQPHEPERRRGQKIEAEGSAQKTKSEEHHHEEKMPPSTARWLLVATLLGVIARSSTRRHDAIHQLCYNGMKNSIRMARYLSGDHRRLVELCMVGSGGGVPRFPTPIGLGCSRTEASTSGGALCMGGCATKPWSSTQSADGLSSAEAELNAATHTPTHGQRRA